MFSLRHHEFLLNVNLAATSLLRSKHMVLEKQKRKRNSGDRGEFPEWGLGSGRTVSRAGTAGSSRAVRVAKGRRPGCGSSTGRRLVLFLFLLVLPASLFA